MTFPNTLIPEGTMNTATDPISDSAAREALQEIDQHVQTANMALSDGPVTTTNQADHLVNEAATAARIETLRNRAAKQRSRGVQNLERRHSGVASLIRNVVLNERVVGSTFQRYFSSIEGGIYVITKTGSFVVGEAAADKLLTSIDEKIKAMEAGAKGTLEQMAVVMSAHAGKDNWLVPQYADAAARHEVQLRSIMANRLLHVFEMYDLHLVQLQQLVWNGEAEADEIETREYEIKTQVRGLQEFIRRSLVGIQTKTQPKASPARAVADAPAEQAAASDTVGAAEQPPVALAA
jgi:hypothetical protein